MIRLSEDGKTLVEINSYEELLERPGFRESLDLKNYKLSKILGPYRFKNKAPCGLSSCRTEHNKGYLVVVEGGLEVNIGHLCGSRIFGVEWGHQKRIQRGLLNQARYRDKLESTKKQLHQITDAITVIVSGEHGAKKNLERLDYWLNKGFDSSTTTSLEKRARRGNSAVTKIIELSQRDTDIEESFGSPQPANSEHDDSSRPIAKEDIVFVIRGLSIVNNHRKFKKLVNVELGEKLHFFAQVDIDSLSPDELRHWNNWASKLERAISTLKSLNSECSLFLNPENINQINQLKFLIKKVA